MRNNIIALVIILVLGGGTVGYIVIKDSDKPQTAQPPVKQASTTKEKSTTDSSSSLNVSTESLGQLDTSSPTNQTKEPTSQEQKILDPSDFEVYDEYIGSDKLYRQDIKAGTGAVVVEGKKVAVLYKGWLTNGTVFDESKPNAEGKTEPFVFTPGAGQVISGWDVGLTGMKVGGVRRLVIPPVGGYGAQGQGNIPPNSVLVFDIQVLEVEK